MATYERIQVGEFRGKGLYRINGYTHLFTGEWDKVLVAVPVTPYPENAIDAEGPITVGPGLYHADREPVTPEEEVMLRPLFRQLPGQIRAWHEANRRPVRTQEEAVADRERNLARYGLSEDVAADTASLCEAERTPLATTRPDRNPGGRCPECGHSHGHRMDCCFA